MNRSKYARKILGAILSALALFFVLRLLVERWAEVKPFLTHVNGWYLAVGALAFSVYFILRAYAWGKIVRLFGYQPRMRDTARVWFLSEFKRYVPGSVWSFLGRVDASAQLGQSASVTLTGLSLEIVFLAASSLLTGAIFFSNRVDRIYQPAIGVGIILLLTLIHPRALAVFFRFAFRLLRRTPPQLPTKLGDHLRILTVFFFAWISYGLGSLLTAASVVPISAENIWVVFGTFILAWAIGYLSIITPMGLGVREGSVLLFLGPVLGAAAAGFLALVTRLWLIVVELAWVGTAFVSSRFQGKFLERIASFFKRRWSGFVLGLLVALYVVFFAAFSILRHENLNSGRFDLGIMDQVVWNTSQGRILQLTDPYGTQTIHRFAIHFDPLLVLFAPGYLLWSDPRLLLILQSLALGLGAIPIYLFSRNRFGPGLSLSFAVAYLFYPALQWVNLFDFHAVAFSIPLLLAAFAAADRRAYRSFTVFAILAILAKEEVALLVAMMGLWLWWKWKRKYVGVNTFVLAGLLGVGVIFFFQPAFDVDILHRGIDYFHNFGQTPLEVVKGIFLQPRLVSSLIVSDSTRIYLSQLLGPVGYLSFFQPFVLVLAWPEFAINLLGDDPALRQILFQYTSGIIPFVFVSAMLGAVFLKRKPFSFWERRVEKPTGITFEGVIALVIFISTAAGSWMVSPLPGTVRDFYRVVESKNRYAPLIRQLQAEIPVEASVSTSNTFGSHFSERRNIFSFPQGADIADYVIVQAGSVKEVESMSVVSAAIDKLRSNPKYEVIREEGRVTVFKRRP